MSRSRDESGLSVGVGCVTVLVAFVIAAPVRAWCGIKIYEWHVRPLFGGPHINVWQAWGLLMFVAILQGLRSSPSDDKKEERSALEAGLMCLFTSFWPLVPLAIAWLLR